MEEHSLKKVDEELLLKYISGELSVAEHKEVEAWIDASKENQQIARDVCSIFLATDAMSTIRSCNTPRALKKVKRRILTDKKMTLFTWFQRIAAILIIPLLITFIYNSTQKTPLEYVELRTAPGLIGKVSLPDGTSVWLNSDSYIRHPREFTGKTREIEGEGEAYFIVKKDGVKKFIVHTPSGLDIEVLGTEFNLEAYKKANIIKTTLVSGSIKLLYKDESNIHQSYILHPEQEFSYNSKSGKIEVTRPYIPTLTSWKDGQVILRKTSFEEALRILSKRYNVEFIVKNINLYNDEYTATIKGEHLLQILEYFRMASGVQYRFVESETEKEKYKIMEKTIVELY